MTKPILWLGPLEELDADYDPLLGRSATQFQSKTSAAKAPPAFDPSRSVFDDPGPLPPQTPPPQPIPEAVLIPEPALEFALEPEPEPESEPEPEPEPEIAADLVTATEPVVYDKAEPTALAATTDFSHNNDPIPHTDPSREPVLDPVALEATKIEPEPKPVAEPEDGSGAKPDSAPVAPPKTFFASLFSKRTITPAAAGNSASINEIWAKAAPEPETKTDTETETEAEPETKTGKHLSDVTETVSADEVEPGVTSENLTSLEPPPAAAIWAKINQEDETQTSQNVTPEPDSDINTDLNQALETILEPNTPADLKVEPELAQPEQSPDALPEEVTPEDVLAEDVRAQEVGPAIQSDASISDTVSSEAIAEEAEHEIINETQNETQNETEHTTPFAEDSQVQTPNEASTPAGIDFQKTFNADKFWMPPPGQKINAQENVPENVAESVPENGAENIAQNEFANDTLDDTQPQGEDKSSPLANEDAPSQAIASEAAPVPRQHAPVSKAAGPRRTGKRRKRKVKKNYVGAFFGTFLFGVAVIMTLASSLAAFGYPFDLMSSYRWYWVILAVLSAGIWGLSRGWKMVVASFVVMGANLFVTVPASGTAPTGGKSATAVIGWANVAGNNDALARVFKDADKKQATLLMLAEAPQSVLSPPVGWTLIEAPVGGDPTAIAVLSKSSWRAATVPGEPTMARPPAGDLTVIGVHPRDAQRGRRRTPIRDALINRAGTRAGIQDGPTIVLGDFNAAPWDNAIRQFTDYGNVTRVRCGGWAGSTLTQAFGFIGVATDHAFVRDVKVTHCQLGGALPVGNHKPIWLYVAPLPTPAPQAAQP